MGREAAWLAKEVWEWLTIVLTWRANRRKEETALLEAFFRALHATKRYVAGRNGGLPADASREAELTELWTRAALLIGERHPDKKDLGDRLLHKASAWADPSEWTAEEYAAAGITLDQLEVEGHEFYAGG